jgi:hypothetical protein
LQQRFELTARIAEHSLLIERDKGHEWIPRLVEAFPAGALRSVNLRRPSLADVFLKLTGKELDEDELGPSGAPGSKVAA